MIAVGANASVQTHAIRLVDEASTGDMRVVDDDSVLAIVGRIDHASLRIERTIVRKAKLKIVHSKNTLIFEEKRQALCVARIQLNEIRLDKLHLRAHSSSLFRSSA